MNKSKLNPAQADAVNHLGGPLLVVAGAGTGKTTVITDRFVHLINSGVPKNQILALTFTEKAATEMLDRTSEQLNQNYGLDLHIHTFNAFGAELLREFGTEIGLHPTARLLGEQGKLVVLREHIDELQLDYFSPVSNPIGQLGVLAEYFSLLKQQVVEPDTYVDYALGLPQNDEASKLEKQRHTELARAYQTYQDICQKNNFIDYDDQIYLPLRILRKRPNILVKLQERFTHILVDEFQDTNPMQAQLIYLLAGDQQNLCVVGDDDQSIYGWRGATLSNILEFTDRYKSTKLVTLKDNYRSTQNILDSAYRLIKNNDPNRLEYINNIDKRLVAKRGSGSIVVQKSFSNIDLELDWVAHDIKEYIQSGGDPGGVAVLCRRAHGVQKIHEALELRGVEHATVGITSSLYAQPIVQTMVQALRCVSDPTDSLALFHTLGSNLFNVPSSVLSELSAQSRKRNVTLAALFNEDHAEIMHAVGLINQWRQNATSLSVGKMAYRILDDTGMRQTILSDVNNNSEGELRAQALFQWFKTLQDFQRTSELATTHSYLAVFEALRADNEVLQNDGEYIDETKPVVMTIHKSKGLEWQKVYIIDCTEGSLPLKAHGTSLTIPTELTHSSAADDHYSEERRLMYVAMTRARDTLVLTYSYSHNGTSARRPSRFITEALGAPVDPDTTSNPQLNLELFVLPNLISSGLPARLYNNETLILSTSQINDYMRCPLDFYYRHILGTPGEPSPSAAVGTNFHAVIQEIQTARINGAPLPEKSTLSTWLKDSWPKEDYLSLNHRRRAMQIGLNSFDTLYERLLTESVPLYIEKPFRVHIPNSNLILRGRIDAILPRDNGIEIRDYKTTIVRDAKSAKSKASSSKQLEMYALAYRIQYGEMPDFVSLDFIQSDIIGTVKKQAKTLDTLEKKLIEVAQNIQKGMFPKGHDHSYCRHP